MAGNEVKAGCSILLLAILSAIPVTMLFLGVLYIDACPMEPWLPRYLVVGGIVGINLAFTSILIMYLQFREHIPAIKCIEIFRIVIVAVMIIWNIVGSVWVFRHWKNWNTLKFDKENGCQNGLFMFTFVFLILFWISSPCHLGAAFSRYRIQRELSWHGRSEKSKMKGKSGNGRNQKNLDYQIGGLDSDSAQQGTSESSKLKEHMDA